MVPSSLLQRHSHYTVYTIHTLECFVIHILYLRTVLHSRLHFYIHCINKKCLTDDKYCTIIKMKPYFMQDITKNNKQSHMQFEYFLLQANGINCNTRHSLLTRVALFLGKKQQSIFSNPGQRFKSKYHYIFPMFVLVSNSGFLPHSKNILVSQKDL